LLGMAQFLASQYGTSLAQAAKNILSASQVLALSAEGSPTQSIWRTGQSQKPPELTDEQAQALRGLREAAQTGRPSYLWGPTGSGKTFVLLGWIQGLLSQGRSAIYLVPEISLTPQFLEFFEKHLPEGTPFALWSSSVNPAKKKALIGAIARGEIRLILGTRSAVFLPLKNLGAIILDEEQDASFKQESPPPCYHAREAALERMRREGIALALASATPSLECYHAIKEGTIAAVRLGARYGASRPAGVRILALDHRPHSQEEELLRKVRETAESGHHCIIYLNRRGFSRTLVCQVCRKSILCGQCDLPLTLHKETGLSSSTIPALAPTGSRALLSLRCHHCGTRRKIPPSCPGCQAPSAKLTATGIGTQQIAETFQKALGLPVLRLDRDTSKNSQSIYSDFKSGQAKVLVGTKLVAKGWHFPKVTLAAVLNADTELTLPDFRSCERAFQTLWQVAGRSGRGADPGEIWIWTSNPMHYIFESLRLNDLDLFYRQELAIRRLMRLPPFIRLLLVELKGKNRAGVDEAARRLVEVWQAAPEHASIEASGAVPGYFQKIRNLWRFQVVLRTDDATTPFPWPAIGQALKQSRLTGVTMRLHPDPHNLF
ncbi:MAG: primosomal protein N', partial [Elusimicrobiota bacterium]